LAIEVDVKNVTYGTAAAVHTDKLHYLVWIDNIVIIGNVANIANIGNITNITNIGNIANTNIGNIEIILPIPAILLVIILDSVVSQKYFSMYIICNILT